VIGYAADMRYVGQEHAVTIELAPELIGKRNREAIKQRFDDVHLLRYGTSAPKEAAEIVSLRTTVTGVMKKPAPERIARGGPTPIAAAQRGTRRVYFAGKPVKTPTYARDALRAGNRIEGPALIEEHASTTVVLPGDRLRVDEFGNLMLDIAGRRK
jgi:N-methylhydantoinase A